MEWCAAELGAVPATHGIAKTGYAECVDNGSLDLECYFSAGEIVSQDLDLGLRARGSNRSDRLRNVALLDVIEVRKRSAPLSLADVEDRMIERVHVQVDVVPELPRYGCRDLQCIHMEFPVLLVVAFDGRLHGAEFVREPRPVDDCGDGFTQVFSDTHGGY